MVSVGQEFRQGLSGWFWILIFHVVESDNGWIWGSEGLKHLGAGSTPLSSHITLGPLHMVSLTWLVWVSSQRGSPRAAGLLTYGHSLKNEYSYG